MTQIGFNPFTDPGALDILVAAGQTNPGLFKLEPGSGREYNIDIKKAPGVQGAFITYRGWLPTEGIVGTFQFWEDGQIEQFYSTYLPLFELDALKFAARPVQVYHPILAANNITQLLTKKIGNLEGNSQVGWTVKLTWVEFRTAKIIRSDSPTGATTRIGKPTVQSKLDAALAAELAKAQQPL